jgi:hypothetical protein
MFVSCCNGVNLIMVTVDNEISLFIEFVREGVIKSSVVNSFPPCSSFFWFFLNFSFSVLISAWKSSPVRSFVKI